ncbi:MAG: type secretion system protein [Chloroflexi bacterium]|nr:type secretion system protein [Chloroflexota bacterium]
MEPIDPAAAAVGALWAVGVGVAAHGVLLSTRQRVSRRLAIAIGAGGAVSEPREVPLVDLRSARAFVQRHPRTTRVVIVLVLAALLVVGVLAGPLLGLLAASLLVVGFFRFSGGQRTRDLAIRQTPDALALLASGLRAGYSVSQAIALVSRESPEPTASHFRSVAREIEVGQALEVALEELEKRTGNADYELVAIIIAVQHEVGGNLAQALDSVGQTVRERAELRQQVSALTAQQRLSSIVLTSLPVGLFVFMFLVDRPFIEPLLSTAAGRALLGLAVAMIVVAWLAMKRLGRVGA